MGENVARALGKHTVFALVTFVVVTCGFAAGFTKSFGVKLPSTSTLNLARQEQHNASLLIQLYSAAEALIAEREMIAAIKTQLEAAATELRSAQEAFVAAASTQTSEVAGAATIITDAGTVDDQPGNELREWFGRYTAGPGADKWSGYLDAYHQHFDRFRAQNRITMVEVGVQSGGSIEMWRSYFGADKLNYIGVDINPKCKQFEKEGVRIVIGDQGDPAFWRKFKSDFPEALDVFIDDGGHLMKQQTVTLDEMFWHVRDGGVYLCEDMHTSYWPDWAGGYLNTDTMVERSKALVDTINAWHSRDDRLKVDNWTRNIHGLHFYDSMVFIDKTQTGPMERVKGGDSWIPYRRRLITN